MIRAVRASSTPSRHIVTGANSARKTKRQPPHARRNGRKGENAMIIGFAQEEKDNEDRGGLTPAGVKTLSDYGHTILVEKNAGEGSGIGDGEYTAANGRIVETADEVWQRAEMVVKVKEPVGPEYKRMR